MAIIHSLSERHGSSHTRSIWLISSHSTASPLRRRPIVSRMPISGIWVHIMHSHTCQVVDLSIEVPGGPSGLERSSGHSSHRGKAMNRILAITIALLCIASVALVLFDPVFSNVPAGQKRPHVQLGRDWSRFPPADRASCLSLI